MLTLSLAFTFTSCSNGSSSDSDDEKPTYTVTFDPNGGTGTMNPQIFVYGEPQKLSPNKFTMDGRDFLGWAKTSGGNIAYDDSSEYTIGAADVTLYAVWGKFVTADNAATVIAGLEGGTRENLNVYMIKITNKILSAEQQKEIGTAIKTVANKTNYYTFFSLDLSSATELTEISEEAFSNCRLIGLILPNSLETIGIGALGHNRFEEIVIPGNVKTIGDGGFEECSYLTEITLPANLTSIGASAFAGCVSLKTVNYKGTQAQWAQIKIDVYYDKLTGAKIICTDGVINGE
ncbi:leucine-rich repeat protein [uncultured Treponema sp.]|uniref:leucine-rich repeat protein n=1 Tax=uncultured Treponema sp. TaxID=162155 RepID=UPI0025CCBA5B|nr:leucine-rich repeat protein [uncultured Treponema sp.]